MSVRWAEQDTYLLKIYAYLFIYKTSEWGLLRKLGYIWKVMSYCLINKLNYLILLTEIWVRNSVDKSRTVSDKIVNLCEPREWQGNSLKIIKIDLTILDKFLPFWTILRIILLIWAHQKPNFTNPKFLFIYSLSIF